MTVRELRKILFDMEDQEMRISASIIDSSGKSLVNEVLGSIHPSETGTKNQHIIDAIATYICVKAKAYDLFTREVDTLHIAGLLASTKEEEEAAFKRAKEILRDFVDWG